MSNRIKQLDQSGVDFYPVTVAQAVRFEDNTDAEVTEVDMNRIFSGNRPIENQT